MRHTRPVLAAAILVCATLLAAPSSQAEPKGAASITVGKISAAQTCTVYQQSEGHAALVATPYAIGAAASWRTWLVRDCVDNFASIRMSIEAALAATGKFTVRPSGGAYVITGRISGVSDGGPAPATPPVGRDGYAVSSSSMFVNMDITVRDGSGRIVFGELFTKHLETGSYMESGGFQTRSTQSGQALYGELQHEVALAAARKVAFRLSPLRVTANDGNEIQLNYGSPLLALGTIVMVTSPDGATTVRYNVTSANGSAASAERVGDGDASRIPPGSTAVVIEADDPAANGRVYKRVDLP